MTQSEAFVDKAVPFGSVFLEHALSARSSLAPSGPHLGPDCIDSMARSLTQKLASIGAAAILDVFTEERQSRPSCRGEGPYGEEQYKAFTASLLAGEQTKLERALPVLASLLQSVSGRWIATTTRLLNRLEDDLPLLHSELGVAKDATVTKIDGPLGDPHNGGDAVSILMMSDGSKVVYKPRSLAQEARVFDLLGWVCNQLATPTQLPTIINRGTYGWMEFVETSPCNDSERYWSQAGTLLAVMHHAGAVDLHNANVIATSTGPIPIDLECVESPILWTPKDHSFGLDETVVATGLLPNHYTGDGSVARDLGGLLAKPKQSGGSWTPQWTGLGTDQIQLQTVLSEWGEATNRPVQTDGKPLPTDLNAIHSHFDLASQVVQQSDCPLAEWAGLPSRVLLASTTVYVDQLGTLTQTDALSDPQVFAKRVRGLPELPKPVKESLGATAVTVVQDAEAQALGRLDVPLHRAHHSDLLVDGGHELVGVLHRSGQDRRQSRLRTNRGAIRSANRQLITLSVQQHEGSYSSPEQKPLRSSETASRQDSLAAAEAIGEHLAAAAIEETGQPSWLEVDQGGHRRMRGALAKTDLYSGSAGIGLFFATLAAATQRSKWESWALRCLDAGPDLTTPWWESGLAGQAYSNAVSGQLLNNDDLLGRAETLMLTALESLPEPDDPMDLVGGWSGVLNSAMAVHTRTESERLRHRVAELAAATAQAISYQLQDAVKVRSIRRAGFAHGISGLAHTMQRASIYLEDNDCGALADTLATFDFERTQYRDNIAGRIDRVNGQRYPSSSWCWGAPGYLLSQSTDEMKARGQDVSAQITANLQHLNKRDRGVHHLCCGEAGELVVLAQLASMFDSPVAASRSKALEASLAQESLEGKDRTFYSTTSFDAPSLFWGQAGIGYALCRVAVPALVPNILLVE